MKKRLLYPLVVGILAVGLLAAACGGTDIGPLEEKVAELEQNLTGLQGKVTDLEAKALPAYEPVTREIWMITRMVMPMMKDAEFAPDTPTPEEMPTPPMQHRFDPGTVMVNKGDTVNLHILVLDKEWHEINIEDWVLAEIVNPGEDRLFTFVADRAGVFEILCANHDTREHHGPMVAYLIVQDVV
ncbi:MAG: cupredoxin domain-containing protein [Dehalococcoidia bacterium]